MERHIQGTRDLVKDDDGSYGVFRDFNAMLGGRGEVRQKIRTVFHRRFYVAFLSTSRWRIRAGITFMTPIERNVTASPSCHSREHDRAD